MYTALQVIVHAASHSRRWNTMISHVFVMRFSLNIRSDINISVLSTKGNIDLLIIQKTETDITGQPKHSNIPFIVGSLSVIFIHVSLFS